MRTHIASKSAKVQLQNETSAREQDSIENPCFSGIETLSRARLYAVETRSDIWDFAVEISRLRADGLSDCDLRWLIRKQFVAHAREITLQGRDGREFQSTGDLTFSRRTCFVLTEEGAANAESTTASQTAPSTLGEQDHNSSNGLPHWDDDSRILRLDERLVKRFKWRAMNQELILSAFHEDGWPTRIDDPLPPKPELDSQRRLSDTIRSLNRKQQNHLIHFRGDGTGEGITWEVVGENTTDDQPVC